MRNFIDAVSGHSYMKKLMEAPGDQTDPNQPAEQPEENAPQDGSDEAAPTPTDAPAPAPTPAPAPAPAAPETPAPTTDDAAGLTGTVNLDTLITMLPDVDSAPMFKSAVNKVKNGDIALLNRAEADQLTKAFISVLRDDSQTTTKVLDQLRNISATPDA